MSAKPARIGFIMRSFRIVTSETAGVTERHGSLARRDEEAVETYFGEPDDAEMMADARQALLSPERRRFSVTVKGLSEVLDLTLAGPRLPCGTYTDAPRGTAVRALCAEVGFDFASQKAQLVIWG